jgi:hypothetical protein
MLPLSETARKNTHEVNNSKMFIKKIPAVSESGNIVKINFKNSMKIRSNTGRVGWGSSGGARKSRVVSFDSENQAQLMGQCVTL